MKSMAFCFLLVTSFFYKPLQAAGTIREFYELTLYHFSSVDQERVIDNYLEKALLPALHKMNIKEVGIFKPLANDTAKDKIVYILIPLRNAEQVTTLPLQLLKDKQYVLAGKEYLEAPYNSAPYQRIERMLLHAFPLAPQIKLPKLGSPKTEHIYEFRSYESATEQLYRNKVKMFNEGGEIVLFNRLQFNAIFYAEVIIGSRMPNLVYMTSFENMEERDKHWKTFVDDAEWKKLSAMPEYKNNVSKADIILMKATAYSDY